MTGRPRLLIVGGDAAGMTAASQARRRVGVDALDMIAFERGDYSSYSACGIPFFVGGEVTEIDDLVARSPEEHRRNGIDMQMRTEVVAIDLGARAITVRDLDTATERVEPFDQLVIATGASPRRPNLPGIDAPGIHGVQTLGDGVALNEELMRLDPSCACSVVVGAGYVGLELAEALHRRGLKVTIVEAGEQPMAQLDPDMGALVADAIRALGIDLRTRDQGRGVRNRRRWPRCRRDDRRRPRCPPTSWCSDSAWSRTSRSARDAGIEIGPTGGIATDARMATSVGRRMGRRRLRAMPPPGQRP